MTDATHPIPPASNTPVPETEVLRLLRVRGSVRNYKPDPVPEEWLNAILTAGQRAPTSSNIQAYSIVVFRNPAVKARLAELAGNQQHIIDCPVFFALCADLSRTAHACEIHDAQFLGHTLEKGLVASIDAALVGMSMTLAADSLGLGTVMIGGMRNSPLQVAGLLNLPRRAYVLFGLCLGWPRVPPLPKPRQPAAAVVHHEAYDPAVIPAALDEYDRELARHYARQGRETPHQSWTRTTADQLSTPRRMNLRQELKELGFDLA